MALSFPRKRFAGYLKEGIKRGRKSPVVSEVVRARAPLVSDRRGRVPQYGVLYSRVSGKQVAIVAVARRILEDAWTMLKKDEVFRLMTVKSELTDECIGDSSAQADVADPNDAG